MNNKVLIVEDQFVEANDLQLMLRKAGYEVCGIARSVNIAREMLAKERPDFVLLDIILKGELTGIDLAKELSEQNIAFVYLSASSNETILNQAKATQPYGFLVKPFREKDLLVNLEIARYRHAHSIDSYLKRENILNIKLSDPIEKPDSPEKWLLHICKTLQPYIPFDYATARFKATKDKHIDYLSFLRIGYDEYQKIAVPELANVARLRVNEITALIAKAHIDKTISVVGADRFDERCREDPFVSLLSATFEIQSYIALPISLSDSRTVTLCFYSKRPDGFQTNHADLLDRLQKAITIGIEGVIGTQNQDINSFSSEGGLKTTRDETPNVSAFEGTIGRSHLMLNVFDLVTQVAPSDTSVLILGESGTGKERIADSIHKLSPRKNGPFVKVNCAALPSTLIESELFGHEKGSFTGALERRTGKFEMAHKGTIFLDEIGEMPVDLQVKLLRVLQERYIERIGAKEVTRVDVRVIAATNRNLEKEVAEGRFRLDLYYRLNVFPIELPALRDRTEDIPLLASHFISIYNRKVGKKLSGLSDSAMRSLTAYHWPGNIRQLENVIERSVLLARGTTIEEVTLPSHQGKAFSSETHNFRMKTIEENERDYIIAVLKKCNGKIWGSGGAAEILSLPPSTLKSKMKKLGIRKEGVE